MPKLNFQIDVERNRDALITEFGKSVLKDRYLMPEESFQDLFVRVATYFADNKEHAQRLYDYMSKMWFMPATPILSNGGTSRGMPISCFLNEASDSLKGIVELWDENVWLASRGGGIGSYWGNVRSINERVRKNGKTSGIMPFIKVQDSMTLAISQGSLRRGSSAVYLPINHPEIEEFIDLRRPTGGDVNRRSLNIHHGVVIYDNFMHAVEQDLDYSLISPTDSAVVTTIKARDLWVKLLTTRIETGEPYLLFIDAVNRHIPTHHKELGLEVKTSNLCCEITLPTGIDHLKQERTAVCCLSSVNLEYFEEWENNECFISDIMKFLDNVLQDFIDNAPNTMEKARYSAIRERSVGLGVMGFHSFLQKKSIPIESVMSKSWNNRIFKHIAKYTDQASKVLSEERGACMDAAECNVGERFSNKTAVAPTASISIIAGSCSAGIEPFVANTYTHKTLTGSFSVRNKYLKQLLASKGCNDEQTWIDISTHEGSVQHLSMLSEREKEIFKTAYEIDQRWLIELAADRVPYISQSQSLNIFLPSNVNKQCLHDIHYMAWKKGVKSMYYCRSTSIQRPDKVSSKAEPYEKANFEECLSCQ